MEFKKTFFLCLVIFFLQGCEREFDNPFDPKTPPLSWQPDDFIAIFDKSKGIVNFSWKSPTENISYFKLNWNLNGNNFDSLIPKDFNNFALKWNAFDTIWLTSIADLNNSSVQFISNSNSAIKNDFFYFPDLVGDIKINPSAAEFTAEIVTFDNVPFPNFQTPEIYFNSLVLFLNSSDGFKKRLPISLLNTGSYRLIDVFSNRDYYLSIIDTSYSENIVLKYSEIFQFQTVNTAFEFLSKTQIKRNQTFTINWENNFNFLDTVDISLIDSGENISIIASDIENKTTFTSIFPSNIPPGNYKFRISSETGIYFGESPSFNLN